MFSNNSGTIDSMKSFQNSCAQSWTDDLPVCKNSGLGFSINQVYRKDGHPQEHHPYEDKCCHYQFNDSFCLYAVFDGYEGIKAADFCCQRMTAEIFFSLNEKPYDDIKDFLRQSFNVVEKGYMDTLGDLQAERTSLYYDMPERSYEVPRGVIDRLHQLDAELASGTAAAVALIYKNKLYVANVGNCRVLLCKTDANKVLTVVQLSSDHNLKNEDEILRLSQLGIDVKKLQDSCSLGNQENTRCLGNYLVKGTYKDHDILKTASQEPVIAVPDIQGAITLNEDHKFLLLMSSGLYTAIKEATGCEDVNQYIAKCVVEQFREQATLTSVAQAVVDKAVRLHHDWYISNSTNNQYPGKREDITLVLRNFNYPLPKASISPTNPTVTFNPIVVNNIYSNDSSMNETLTRTEQSTINTNTSDEGCDQNDDGVGPDQKIAAYVDFSDYYKNYKTAKENGTLPDGLDRE